MQGKRGDLCKTSPIKINSDVAMQQQTAEGNVIEMC